jgi:hypothetical protein
MSSGWIQMMILKEACVYAQVERFWMQSDMVLVFIISVAFQAITRFVSLLFALLYLIFNLSSFLLFRSVTIYIYGPRKASLSYVFACMAGIIITCLQMVLHNRFPHDLHLKKIIFQRNFSKCDNGSNTLVRDFGATMLDAFPPNALVLTKGDLPTNAMR